MAQHVAVRAQDYQLRIALKRPSAMPKRHRAASASVRYVETAATERWKRGSDATERTATDLERDATERATTTEVMTTPAFDAATCDIAVGPCRLRCMKDQHGMLCKMQEEIDRRFRVPVSLRQLLQTYDHAEHAGFHKTVREKSWSSIIEGISRCIAAFQKATDATEHSHCQDIVCRTCDYAIALTQKIPAYVDHGELLALVHQYIKNRTYNLAFTDLLTRALLDELPDDDPFWGVVGDPSTVCGWRQKEECLVIIEMCMNSIKKQAEHWRREMDVYRALDAR